jgi:hypothetical protein
MKKADEKGQALIELIIFLPLMFTLYAMIAGFANAINGSINQQKITRSYFYYRVQNNSTVPKPDKNNTFLRWGTFGMYFIGWKDYFMQEERPVAPCYQVSVPLEAEHCDQKYSQPNTLQIRVQTVYGICGATYHKRETFAVPVPDFSGMDKFYRVLHSRPGCEISP